MFLNAVNKAGFNRFVEWAHNYGQRGRHSSMQSAPLLSIHGQRSASG